MPMLSSSDEHYHILRGAGVDPRDSPLGNKAAHYSAKRNLNLKVLDFVKSGGASPARNVRPATSPGERSMALGEDG